MKENLRTQLEEYIDDWHCDMEDYESALMIGKFLFAFMNYLDDENLSERTQSKYEENVELIGMFETEHAYNGCFFPEDLEIVETYEREYKRTIAYSKTQLKYYQLTWKKLKKYVSEKKYEQYLEDLEEAFEYLAWANDVIDFTQAVRYSKVKDLKIVRDLKSRTELIEENYVEYEDCASKEAYNEFITKAWDETVAVCKIIDSSNLAAEEKSDILKQGKKLTDAFYMLVNN